VVDAGVDVLAKRITLDVLEREVEEIPQRRGAGLA
jgi:hypothetical protein